LTIETTPSQVNLFTPNALVLTNVGLAGTWTDHTSDSLVLGNDGVNWFTGFIYELWIFSTALTTTGLQSYYTTGGACPYSTISPAIQCLPNCNTSPCTGSTLACVTTYSPVCRTCTPCLYSMCTCLSSACSAYSCTLGIASCSVNCLTCQPSDSSYCTSCADLNATPLNGVCICNQGYYNRASATNVQCSGII
jgi:hypothetical protein